MERKKNLQGVESLGFTPRLVSATGQTSLYVFEDEQGAIHDNEGHGFSSSAALLEAAKRVASERKDIAS